MMPASRTRAVRTRGSDPRAHGVDRHVGAGIRKRRVTLGLTRQRLAGLGGISYQQQRKREPGPNRVRAGRLHAIAGVLEAEPGWAVPADRPVDYSPIDAL